MFPARWLAALCLLVGVLIARPSLAAEHETGASVFPYILASEQEGGVVIEGRVTGAASADGTIDATLTVIRLANGNSLRSSQGHSVDASVARDTPVGQIRMGGDPFETIEATLVVMQDGDEIGRATLVLIGR